MAQEIYYEEAYRIHTFSIEKDKEYAEIEVRWVEYNSSRGRDIIGFEWEVVTPSTDEDGNVLPTDWISNEDVRELIQNYDD